MVFFPRSNEVYRNCNIAPLKISTEKAQSLPLREQRNILFFWISSLGVNRFDREANQSVQ
jgi:hypothetical protein